MTLDGANLVWGAATQERRITVVKGVAKKAVAIWVRRSSNASKAAGARGETE